VTYANRFITRNFNENPHTFHHSTLTGCADKWRTQ